jgi:hypothetical protein
MRNEDIAQIGQITKEQTTPVIVVESLSLPELNQRIKACDWLQTISLDTLADKLPRMGHGLGLLSPPADFHYSKQAALDALAERIWPLIQTKGQIKSTNSMSIFGLGKQWILAVNQTIAVNKHDYNITKRFYLEGDDPRNANLLRSSLVLADQAQARSLAKLSPAPPPLIVAGAAENQSSPSAPAAATPAAQTRLSKEDEVSLMLKAWLKAWNTKNLRQYMSYYAGNFRSDKGQNYAAWKTHKTNLFRTYKTINVKADNIAISFKNDRSAVITFRQDYRSDWTRDTGIKTLNIVKREGRWLIVGESWVAGK